MTTVRVGDVAPPLRLPSAQGPDVALEDFRGRRNVVLWFTKGMGCSFCRQQMSQLARGAARLDALGTEILQVTSTKLDRARLYAQRFRLPFPYLCDASYAARRAWGMDIRSPSVVWYAKTLVHGITTREPESDYGSFKPALGELPSVLADDDMGLFIVDRAGVVRYGMTASYFDGSAVTAIPGTDAIVREVERVHAAA